MCGNYYVFLLQSLVVRFGDQAVAGENAALAQMQLDDIKTAMSTNQRDLNKLERFVYYFFSQRASGHDELNLAI